MRMTLYRSNSRGNAKNCSYPVKCVVDNEEDCLAATAFDHVCGKFKGSYRSVDNFEEADCSVADCDNSHSDNPKDWVYRRTWRKSCRRSAMPSSQAGAT